MMQAIGATHPGGHFGDVGVSHDARLPEKINPGRVFDVTLPLDDAAEGYAAMDARAAITVQLQP